MAAAAAASGEYGPKQSGNSDGIAAEKAKQEHLFSEFDQRDGALPMLLVLVWVISRSRGNN